MKQKRNLVFMFILITTTCCLHGCLGSNTAQTNTPTIGPSVSEPATPTPANTSDPTSLETIAPTATGTPAPTATSTPTPTPTATPTPTPTPTPIPTVPPAPVAVNTDTTTLDFIVNRDYPLATTYRPADLTAPDIPFSFGDKTLDKRKLTKVAAEALEELYAAALAEEGLTIYGVSGYRSYDRQYDIYGANIITRGTRETNLYSAAPGTSEHQTGLAMDVSCKSINYALDNRFASTPEGKWLAENCWRFGFILRYPKDKEAITGYAYEPWHIRYVGIPLAYYLYTNNLTLEEYYGAPFSLTLAELANLTLIDTTTERFYKLYAKTLESELIYKEDGSVWLSEATGLPMLKELIRDAKNQIIRANGTAFFIEPIYDAFGNYVLDAEGNILYTKPYFDAEGNLWLDFSGAPVYLQPLWNADGTLATDAAGNILYTEPEKDLSGMEKITETGSLTQKVPVRDENGELTYNEDGSVCFYEPFINPATGDYIYDETTGLPLYPYQYYEVPHNTLPLEKTFSEDELWEDAFFEDDFFEDEFFEDETMEDGSFEDEFFEDGVFDAASWEEYYWENFFRDETGGLSE